MKLTRMIALLDEYNKKAFSLNSYEISNTEAERIASKAKTAEEFVAIWSNETWWTDGEARP